MPKEMVKWPRVNHRQKGDQRSPRPFNRTHSCLETQASLPLLIQFRDQVVDYLNSLESMSVCGPLGDSTLDLERSSHSSSQGPQLR